MALTTAERAALRHVHRIWSRHTALREVYLTCADCGEHKPHHGKGRCARCYMARMKQRSNQ